MTTTQPDEPDAGAEGTQPDWVLVDLHVVVGQIQVDWLTGVMVEGRIPTMSETVRRVLDRAQEEDDVLAARAHASGYAALAAEYAEQYRRDLEAGVGDAPGEETALELAACERRCLAARERVERLRPTLTWTWPPLLRETDPALAERFDETILQYAVRAVREVRAERQSAPRTDGGPAISGRSSASTG